MLPALLILLMFLVAFLYEALRVLVTLPHWLHATWVRRGLDALLVGRTCLMCRAHLNPTDCTSWSSGARPEVPMEFGGDLLFRNSRLQ